MMAYSIAVAGFSFFVIASYPGFMSPDSFSQYSQSLRYEFYDTHPPIMSGIWSLLNFFFDGPQGMLYLQLFLLWSGLLLWSQNAGNRPASLMYLMLGFAPWVANFEAAIWKDVQMAGALILLCALLMREQLTKVSWTLIFVLAFYAFTVRINAPAALLPIFWYALSKTERLQQINCRIWAVFVLVVGMFLANQFFTYVVLQAERGHIVEFMMTDDLVNLSVVENRSLIPGVDFADLSDCSKEVVGDTTFVGRVFCLSKRQSFIEAQPIAYDVMKAQWISAIWNHPLEVLKHRIRAFAYLLRSPAQRPYIHFYFAMQGGNLNIPVQDNRLTSILSGYVQQTARNMQFLFKPYFWLLAGLALLVTSYLRFFDVERARPARMLIFSGLFYLLGYIPLAPMADFRYAYWTTIAVTLSALHLLLGRTVRSSEKP